MSEEEKKAIKVIKHRTGLLKCELEVENEYKDDEPRIFYLMEQIQSNEVILNLIENQQKEIEELKNKILRKSGRELLRQENVLKQKIKDKLEEYINSLKENLDEDRIWCDIEFIENLESLKKELLED